MSTQQAFSRALLDSQLPCPAGLFSANGADPESRFAVYRNNVQSSLLKALAENYPVVVQLVGDAFFQAMAAIYAKSFPPASPLMSDFGHDFGDFIQGFPPAASVPYLADVARLERLRVQAYHAADAPTTRREDIAATLADPELLAGLRLKLNPSVMTLNSPYAIVSLWAAHQNGGRIEDVDPSQGESALVLRHGLTVEVFAVDNGCLTFVQSLLNGCPLEMAAAYGHDATEAFDLSQSLALLIAFGVITQLQQSEKHLP